MMMTKKTVLDALEAGGPALEEVVAILAGGGVAVIPTETFYGLAASAFSRDGVEKIYALKKRDGRKPLPLIASDIGMVEAMAARLPEAFRPLAGQFWPGPLTMVLEASSRVPDFICGPGRTVAVRVPPLDPLRRLILKTGCPLTATSANLSGEREIAEYGEAAALFEGSVELLIDGGRTPGGKPSTIIDLVSGEPKIVREGIIPPDKIFAVLAAGRF